MNSPTQNDNASTPRVPVIAIHGGAGTISAGTTTPEQAAAYHEALRHIVATAQAALLQGASALDATCLAVELLEDCPLFNAGHGAVFTHDETHELDAAVMDGATLAAGAVAGVCHVRRPVRLARAVLEDGAPALRFYEKLGFVREGTLRKFYKRAGEADYIDDHLMALLLD